MAKKITYSRHDTGKRRVPYDEESAQDGNGNRKRPKVSEPNNILPPTPPSSSHERTSSLLKKPLRHNGPVSIPNEEMQIDPAPKRSKNLHVFDKVLQGRHQFATPKQHSIYGSQEQFAGTVKDEQRKKQETINQRNGHLPTPPAETGKAMTNLQTVGGKPNAPVANGSAIKPASKTVSIVQVPLVTARSIAHATKAKPLKEMYQPRAYEAENTVAPCKTILGSRLSRKSESVHLWSNNQTHSPFLRLPGEIRNLIYEYALGGKTINISYESYRQTYKLGKVQEVVPVFKYRGTIYNQRTNPFGIKQQPYINTSTGFTLLNSVCRQMYLETATLPYELNLLSFGSYNTMFNFLYMEKRLSRQQLSAITMVILPDALPQPNMLNYLTKLEKVFLAVELNERSKGWYYVAREDGTEPKMVTSKTR